MILFVEVIFLIGNKSDLDAQRDVTYEEAKQFADENGLMFVEARCSTLNLCFFLACFFSLCSLYYPYFFSFLCFLSFFLPTLVKIGSSLPLKQYANNNKLMLVKPGLLLSVSSFSIFPSVCSLFSLCIFLSLPHYIRF